MYRYQSKLIVEDEMHIFHVLLYHEHSKVCLESKCGILLILYIRNISSQFPLTKKNLHTSCFILRSLEQYLIYEFKTTIYYHNNIFCHLRLHIYAIFQVNQPRMELDYMVLGFVQVNKRN